MGLRRTFCRAPAQPHCFAVFAPVIYLLAGCSLLQPAPQLPEHTTKTPAPTLSETKPAEPESPLLLVSSPPQSSTAPPSAKSQEQPATLPPPTPLRLDP